VEKAIMAPRVATADKGRPPRREETAKRPLSGPAHPAEQMLRKLREHIEKNSTYVGDRFAAEARAMHVGDKDEAPSTAGHARGGPRADRGRRPDPAGADSVPGKSN
jgi:hypothetical protein